MLILPKQNLIFIHIPKAAGQSISTAIGNLYGLDRPFYYDGFNPKKNHNTAHLTANQIRKLVPPDFWNGAFKFAVIRNEHERLVSFYHWIIEQTNQNPFNDFDHFIQYVVGEIDMRFVKGGGSWMRTRIPCIHYIGSHKITTYHMDELDELKSDLSRHLGQEVDIPHINKSKHNSFMEYYTISTFNKVEKWAKG